MNLMKKNVVNLKLVDIVDINEIQAIVDEFYKITNVGIGFIDMEGNVLIANGWQDVCTKFHRINNKTCKNCIESDTVLSKVDSSEPGKLKAYKCKNNLWDISTPIVIDGHQYGNIFLGQFFYDDEIPDYDIFRRQARKYGFDEKEYIAALDRVPRWSREKVENVLSFYSRMATLISQLSFSKLKLAETLAERDKAEETLKNSFSLLRIAGETARFGGWFLNLATKKVTWSDEVAAIHEVPAGYSPLLNEGIQYYAPEWRDKITSVVNDCAEKGVPYDEELELITAKGKRIWVRTTGEAIKDETGNVQYLQGAFQDITERKSEAEVLRQSEEKFRELFEDMAEGAFYQLANGSLVDINPAGLNMFGITKEQFLGRTLYHPEWKVVDEVGNILPPDQHISMRALETGHETDGVIGVFNPVSQSVRWLSVNAKPQFKPGDKKPYQVFVTMHDITDRKLKESINTSRLHLVQFSQSHSLDELLEETLNEAERLTGSQIAFFHFVEDNQEELRLQNWSTGTKKIFCKAEGKGAHYAISQAGVWVECFYTRKPVIHNDYASLPNRKVMPEGHAEVIRELVVPIIRGDKVIAILGVGNKPADYGEQDIETVSILANLAWEITGLKRAEEALHKREKKYRRITENMSDVVWTCDLNFKITYISRSCERLFGEPLEKYVKRAIYEKFTPNSVQLFQSVLAEEWEKEKDEAIDKNRSRLLEIEHFRADGTRIWVDMKVSFIRDKKGNPTGLQGVSRDISERKHAKDALQASESRFKAIFDNSSVAIYQTDAEGKCLLVNKQWCKFSGISPDEAMGDGWQRALHPDDRERMFTLWNEFAHTGKSWNFEYRFRTPDEVETWVLGTAVPLYNEHNKITGFLGMNTDITELKLVQTALNNSEKEFRSVFENAPIGIYRTSPDGQILMANPFLLEMLEYDSFEELAKRNLQQEGYEPDYPREVFMQLLERDGKVIGLESSWRTRSGKTVKMSESARIIRDDDGNILYYEGMVEDITRQKQYEESLKYERNILRTLIDNLPDAIYFLDKKGRKVIANKADLKNIGIENEEEVLDKNDIELFAGEIGKRGHADNLSVLQTGNPIINREEYFFDKNGVQTWLLTSKFPMYDAHGKVTGLVGIGHDITERKKVELELRESEERYRVFINSTQDMAFVKDEYMNYLLVNRSLINFFGRDESDIIGKPDSELMPAEFAGNCEKSDRATLESDTVIISEEKINDKIYETHKFKVPLKTGKTGIGGYIRDITGRKEAEKLVIEQSEKLSELNATKDKFFSIIAHDLRNPFNSIIGFSSILKEEAHSLDIGEMIHYAGIINNAASNTMILLDNLLDWALMQQNRIEFVPKMLVLNELAKDAIASVANNAGQKNIQLINKIPNRLIIKADENMIKTVVRNLVNNAIKFTKPGGKVEISAIEENNEVRVMITDNGVGISEENIAQLFNISSGFSTRGTNNEKGTGLGLILCKEFIEKHGGHIWVKSQLGAGSTFGFNLQLDLN